MAKVEIKMGEIGGGGATYVAEVMPSSQVTYNNVNEGIFAPYDSSYGARGYIVIKDGNVVQNALASVGISATYSNGTLTFTKGSVVDVLTIYGYYS